MARMMKKMGKMGGLGGLKNMMSSLGGASPNPGLGMVKIQLWMPIKWPNYKK